jgi:hypothetical protein
MKKYLIQALIAVAVVGAESLFHYIRNRGRADL